MYRKVYFPAQWSRKLQFRKGASKHHYFWDIFATVLTVYHVSMVSCAGFAANDSFQSSLEDAGRQYACPGEVVNYTCTVVDTTGNPPLGSSVWRGTAFNCPTSSNEISLRHSSFSTSSGATDTCNNGAMTAESVGVVDNCFTSRLMVNVSSTLNETTVECTLSGVRVVGNRTILIAGM